MVAAGPLDYVAQLPAGLMTDGAGFGRKVKLGWPAYKQAQQRGLSPTPYFFEALDYARKAKVLQTASLKGGRVPKVGDPLMEAIPIYNTVERRYAGFSNLLELLWYGVAAPKYMLEHTYSHTRWPPAPSWRQRVEVDGHTAVLQWLVITLAHRITGSGASFEHDHGFRNSHVLEMAATGLRADLLGGWLARREQPIFTSIGNQIPPFNKPDGAWTSGGRQYLAEAAYDLSSMTYMALLTWVDQRRTPMPIKEAVDMVLRFQKVLGFRQFKFVLTAWVMDMAEYLPHLVDRRSDVYHGKNAIEAIGVCFSKRDSHWGTLQQFYDAATRLFADVTGTTPMDVEDAAPGCDFVRWLENYVPKKGFDHVHAQAIHNGSSLVWRAGRQPR